VRFHELELLRLERPRLPQQAVRDGQHPDVVEESAPIQRLQILVAQPERAAQGGGIVRHAVAMPLGVAIPRLDHHRERGDDRRRRVEVVGVPLHPDQGANPRQQFVRIDRLCEEIVGAGVESLDAGVGVSERRDQHHGREPGAAIPLDPLAHFEAILPGHHDVEQHDVGVERAHRHECRVPVVCDVHGIPSRPEKPFEESGDRWIVVHDQHVGPATFLHHDRHSISTFHPVRGVT
jgi:hypothetical protein